MTLLSKVQIEQFHEKGFVVIKRALSKDEVVQARSAYSELRQKVIQGKHKYGRTHHDYAFGLIIGIEQLFSKTSFSPTILKVLQSSKVLPYAKEILKVENPILALHRLICTYNKGFSGAWHRDGPVNKLPHMQAALLFYPESGFKVIPGSHCLSDKELGFDWKEQYPCEKKIDDEIEVCAQAGDLVLFHSSILHRGTCVGRNKYQRAQIHLRILDPVFANEILCQKLINPDAEKIEQYASSDWKAMLFNTIQLKKLGRQQSTVPKLTPLRQLKKIKSECAYYLCKFNITKNFFRKTYKSCQFIEKKKEHEHLYK